MKRLTLDLTDDLHRRIKIACVSRGSAMVEEITKLLEKEFPKVSETPVLFRFKNDFLERIDAAVPHLRDYKRVDRREGIMT